VKEKNEPAVPAKDFCVQSYIDVQLLRQKLVFEHLHENNGQHANDTSSMINARKCQDAVRLEKAVISDSSTRGIDETPLA